MAKLTVKCPVCGRAAVWDGNSYRPFCSEKCSMIDLGKWADGRYSIASEEGDEGEDKGDGQG